MDDDLAAQLARLNAAAMADTPPETGGGIFGRFSGKRPAAPVAPPPDAGMMPFFLTMPISRMMPMMPITDRSMNSIAIYVMSWTMEPFVRAALERHLGWLISSAVSPVFQPIAYGFGIMLSFWLILFWMYRRKLFLRI